MDNLKFLHNYNLNCVATDSETNKVLFGFTAREFSIRENGGGYEAGGIASGSQKYAIKTSDCRVKELKPYANNIVVEGIDYALVFLKIRKNDTPFKAMYQRGKNDEYILELE
ncbi:MAG: hypothetical protein RR338_00165 [Clostridia bacterium]